jgi:energy-coupling factor transport system permease protein
VNGLFSYYLADSFLHRRNPAVKLLCLLLLVLAVTLAFDPWTPAAFLLLALVALRLLGRVPLRVLAWPLLALGLLGAVGFVGANALFYAPAAGGGPLTVLWHSGPWRVTAEGLRAGVTLALRMLAIVAFSMVLVTTTDPTDLVLSLIQNARFPFRVGYGLLVAYRFLPLWQNELGVIRAAHRIRGVGERLTLAGRWQQLRRYAVPLLASAIRKAERVAIAMESRAFGALPRRTYYRQLRVTPADGALLAGTLLATALILLALARAGLLAGFGAVPPA